jgi:hypothetical protein
VVCRGATRRTVCRQKATRESRRAAKQLGARIYQANTLRVGDPAFRQIVRGAEPNDAAPEDNGGAVGAMFRAHREHARGNEGHYSRLHNRNSPCGFMSTISPTQPGGTSDAHFVAVFVDN